MSTTEGVTIPESMTYEEVMKRTRALLPAIRERAAAAEAARRQPQETIQDITNAGLVRMLVPKRWGGYEMDYDTFSDSVIEISKADASAGWCYGFLTIHSWFLARFPREAQRDVWEKNPDASIADSFVPGGQVTRTENGYLLSGKWPWVSGVDYCDWSILLAFLSPSDGVPPTPHLFLVPRSDYGILDTWFVAGLRASGSNTIVIQNAFVPTHRVISVMDVLEGTAPGAAVNSNPIYQHPLLAVFPTALVSVIYGATRGMYETWRDISRTKASLMGDQIASFSHVQIRMAEIEGDITAARLFLRHILAGFRSGNEITLETRIRNHRDYAYLTQLCARAAERIYQASGGGANYESNALQRYWRDIHAMSVHVALNLDAAGETFGRHELGLSRNPRDPYI